MLKIKKFKKKKKDKRNHKENDSDLFDPEELEAYKQRQRELAQEQSASEEWKQFNELTADIDTVLKRTQGNLDRIKSTSFFQRVERKVKQQSINDKLSDKPIDVEDQEKRPIVILTEEDFQIKSSLNQKTDTDSEINVDDENELEDDIFDTSYVDVIESGQCKLAYIPESPSESDSENTFDPFDTSAAEAAILGPTTSNLNLNTKLLPLGVAVEVLSGRVDNIKYIPIKPQGKRRRFKTKNLLLQSVDLEDSDCEERNNTEIQDSVPSKTILDDDCDPVENLPSKIDLSVNLHSPIVNKSEEKLDEIDEEFARIATDSIRKINLVEDYLYDDSTLIDKDDPFDTSIANNINPSKAELKIIEKEILNDLEDELFDPRSEEKLKLILSPSVLNNTSSEDLLKRTTSIFDFTVETIKPTDCSEYKDPFDTSIATKVSKPGQIELKFIANEILNSLDDDNFDPRAFEINESIEQKKFDSEIKESQKVSIPLSNKFPENNTTDLLLTTEDNLDLKVLTPTIELEKIIDPFDTSICDKVVIPGKTELKILEKELDTPVLKDSFSSDIFSSNTDLDLTSIAVKPLSPIIQTTTLIESSDPFDTSIASNLTLGKIELKTIESELIK